MTTLRKQLSPYQPSASSMTEFSGRPMEGNAGRPVACRNKNLFGTVGPDGIIYKSLMTQYPNKIFYFEGCWRSRFKFSVGAYTHSYQEFS